jgi:hypothetical protein
LAAPAPVIVGKNTAPTTPQPTAPNKTAAPNGNFFNDSGNQVFAEHDSAQNMMTQEDVEQEVAANEGTMMEHTIQSNARKSA